MHSDTFLFTVFFLNEPIFGVIFLMVKKVFKFDKKKNKKKT